MLINKTTTATIINYNRKGNGDRSAAHRIGHQSRTALDTVPGVPTDCLHGEGESAHQS